ncbi:phage major capsid protein [Mycobacterium sp. EPa45]|uniref:phage major capsid protein n=1 Tax=Mycobacterium sp. EPa45 TaxID=1545728 RepID=UPI000641D3B1|nr:phage major capsid protein [Mycobacterium sp. EPa45]AKK30633.1 hypothetical protein AB431_17645 [Mycobacterium sp. EPa45]
MTNPFNTTGSAKAFHIDVEGAAPAEIIPNALILNTSTKAGNVKGDEPYVRVPKVDLTDAPDFVAEGDAIEESDPDDDEVLVGTSKIAVLFPVSIEQYQTGQAAELLSNATRRAMTRKANAAYLAQAAPTPPAVRPPAGIIHQGVTDGGVIGEDLDALIDAIAAIENAGGEATNILAHPNAWATLSKLKSAVDSNVSLIGAGTEPADRRLLGVGVTVDRDVPEDSIIVLDKEAILSVYGGLEIASSEHYYFNRQAVAIRATWRFGATIHDASRVVLLGVDGS